MMRLGDWLLGSSAISVVIDQPSDQDILGDDDVDDGMGRCSCRDFHGPDSEVRTQNHMMIHEAGLPRH